MAGFQSWRFVELPKIRDPRGNLTFLENCAQLPFEIGSVSWTYDIPSGADLDCGAFYANRQLVVALSGSFDLSLDDGATESTVRLSSPDKGLLIEPCVWRRFLNFATNSVALVVGSVADPEADRIATYETFKQLTK